MDAYSSSWRQIVTVEVEGMSILSFVWLEITGRCQLNCSHCYAESGPWGDHGIMMPVDWRRVIDEVADQGAPQIQFIGGEPTLHPGLPGLINYALARSLEVEVFTNLLRVTPELWETFSLPGVRLATSYYSTDPAVHNAVTRRGSHDGTLAGMREAVGRSIPLRASVVDVLESQRVDATMAELTALGVTNITVDRMRGVGRGLRDASSDIDQLCGHCADGRLAVSPSGEVWPCIMSRWLPVGNVLETPLMKIHALADGVRRELAKAFADRSNPCIPGGTAPCAPSVTCGPYIKPSPDGNPPPNPRPRPS